MQSTNAHVESGRNPDGSGRAPQLSDVVRDALDHAHVIARDSISLGRLEVAKVVADAKSDIRVVTRDVRREVSDTLPRIGYGALATALGTGGFVFLSLAIFLGLGAVIPSLAARFGIFAVVYIGLAAIAAARMAKGRPVLRTRQVGEEDHLRHVAPIHPIDGEII